MNLAILAFLGLFLSGYFFVRRHPHLFIKIRRWLPENRKLLLQLAAYLMLLLLAIPYMMEKMDQTRQNR